MQRRSYKKLIMSLLFIPMIILAGTSGYMLVEGWSFFDSLFMTIITISTTGYQEVQPLSTAGRLLSMGLIFMGVLVLAFVGGRAVQLLIETEVFRRRRMSKKIEDLSDHYIICGFGRMGKHICESLQFHKKPFVVIEKDKDIIEMLIELDYLFVNGDATHDEDLLFAGLNRAKGFMAVTGTDAENLFAALTARQLNESIFIVTRAIDESTESKLIKAGANRVVKPYELSGNRMVQLLLRPGVMDFIDVVARKRGREINLEEITVKEKSNLVGQSLMESPIRKDLNIIIVAVNRGEEFIYNPVSSTRLEEGDRLIAIGESDNLEKLINICVPEN